MGGSAFAKGPDPLYTPRMAPTVYKYVRDKCHAILRELFVVVATPIEGPGKSDYGDVDIFVAWKKQELFPSSTSSFITGACADYPFDTIKGLLGAERIEKERESVAMLAIPWPKELPEGIEDNIENDVAKSRFIQVDIHICLTLESLEWFLFKHAHGDLWNILGSTIRPYGLTVDEIGLYLRIPEIQEFNKKKAKVLLTRDPSEVLRFLGLKVDGGEWAEKFDTMDDVFEYAATSRFFWVRPDSGGDDSNSEERVGGEFERKKLKSNDRKRMNVRPLFRAWIEEFLPKCREEGRFTQQSVSKDEVREEAFRFFGVQKIYELQLVDLQKQRQKERLKNEVIKDALPTELDPQWRSCALSALKRIIMDGDITFGIYPPESLRDENGIYMVDKVRRFVVASWQEVGQIAWKKNQERYHQSLAVKTTKRVPSDTEKGFYIKE